MKKWIKHVCRLKSEKGAIAIIVGISMVMFIGFTALAVDIGHLMVTSNELQNVADAAALAATRWLGNHYTEDLESYEEQQARLTLSARGGERVHGDEEVAGMSGRGVPAVSCAMVALLATVSTAVAQVTVTAATGSYGHGDTLRIQGRGFGQKDPAAPLIWDDGEDRAVNDVREVSAKGWSDPWPRSGISVEHLIQYRSAPYRNTPAPHQFSHKYLAGGHYQDPDNDPPYIGGGGTYRAVMVTVDPGSARPRWFSIFYYRLDPLWRYDSPPNNNHKTTTVQAGPSAYYGVAYSYDNYRSQNPESVEFPRFGYHGVPPACVSRDVDDYPPTNSPRTDWVHYEMRIANDDALGFKDLYIDNHVGMKFQTNCPNWFSLQGGEFAQGIKINALSMICQYQCNTQWHQNTKQHMTRHSLQLIKSNVPR